MYLAHLLIKVIMPVYQEECQRYVSSRATDVCRLVEENGGDAYRKFFVYQVNADYILLFLSVFEELGRPAYGEAAGYQKSASVFEGYGRTYYSFAATYCRLAQRYSTDLSEVLADLSNGFGKYRLLLNSVKRDYFDLLHHLDDSQLVQLRDQISSYEQSVRREEMLDAWLDLYSVWLQGHDAGIKRRLDAMASELRALDPTIPLPSLA